MIIWLASYPRSGNTLLRQLLHDTLGLSSFSDEKGERELLQLSEAGAEAAGVLEFDGTWSDFRRTATASPERVLVKTHRAPPDGQPAIYVVRDGRKTLVSYARFHERFTQAPRPTLLDLVLGLDFYGGWSDHYRQWLGRSAPTLLLRYEELVAPSSELLQRLAAFVGHSTSTTGWTNPFDALHARHPGFYRQGEVAWSGDKAWTPSMDAAFMHLHGDLMVELGYLTRDQVEQACVAAPDGLGGLVDVVRKLVAERNDLRLVCEERQSVIEDLKSTCDERLALIQRLSGVA